MTLETHEKAKKILSRIEHIDKFISFLFDIRDSKMNLVCKEAGFTPNPVSMLIDDSLIPVLIDSLNTERERLEQEFNKL